ncbi:hypothetical protein RUND412_004774 [Rhizina undulata]
MELFQRKPLQVQVSRVFSTTPRQFLSEEEKKKERQMKEQKKDPKADAITWLRPPPQPPKTVPPHTPDADIFWGLRGEWQAVKDTFALREVPREVYFLGLVGLSPYVITSLTTYAIAWDMNHAVEGVGYLFSPATTENLLHILEPVQIGLGAIILSFLGAVHWGLEMAEYGGKFGYKRYLVGILAPIAAWPTVLFSLEAALVTQFLAFINMYFFDATVAGRGWAPRWYATYRFVLTFVVGIAITLSLVARAQIGDRVSRITGPATYLRHLRIAQSEHEEEEHGQGKKSNPKEKAKAGKGNPKEQTQQGAGNNSDSEAKSKSGSDSGPENSSNAHNSGEGGETAADPGKRAKGDGPGKQGVYSDVKQGNSGELGDTSPYSPAEPTPEKKGLQQPMPERKEDTGNMG